jgi:hypothetical protein
MQAFQLSLFALMAAATVASVAVREASVYATVDAAMATVDGATVAVATVAVATVADANAPLATVAIAIPMATVDDANVDGATVDTTVDAAMATVNGTTAYYNSPGIINIPLYIYRFREFFLYNTANITSLYSCLFIYSLTDANLRNRTPQDIVQAVYTAMGGNDAVTVRIMLNGNVVITFRNDAEPKTTKVDWVIKAFGKSANLAKKKLAIIAKGLLIMKLRNIYNEAELATVLR